jgi:hypothetical protein
VVRSQLRPLRGIAEETIHESMSRCAAIEKNSHSAGFEPAQAKRDRFGFCCGSTTWLGSVKMHIWRNHPQDGVKVCSDEGKNDNVVVTQLSWTSKESMGESSRRVPIEEKPCRRQVSNLHYHSPRDRFKFCWDIHFKVARTKLIQASSSWTDL